MLTSCAKADFSEASSDLQSLWEDGYAAIDIISTMFRVLKTLDMQEYLKLEFMKVREMKEREKERMCVCVCMKLKIEGKNTQKTKTKSKTNRKNRKWDLHI